MNRNPYFERTIALADEIRRISREILDLNERLASNAIDISFAELDARTAVANAVGPDGKPLHSNEDKRKAAVAEALRFDAKYQGFIDTRETLTREREERRIDLQHRRDLYGAHTAYAAELREVVCG